MRNKVGLLFFMEDFHSRRKNRKTKSTGNHKKAGGRVKELFESEKYKTWLNYAPFLAGCLSKNRINHIIYAGEMPV